jgi:hypothetical protein
MRGDLSALGCGVLLGSLLLWNSPARAQRPSDSDSAALIERSRQKALDYTRSLPDFVCTEVVRRSTSTIAHIWAPADTLTIKLSYFQQAEQHKLEQIDGKPTERKYEDLEAATSKGEFGGTLRVIFDPASEAAFDWESWKNVRNRRIAVYQYAVSAAHSPYSLKTDNRSAVVGIYGVLEIDNETGEVLHLTYVAYDIPKKLDLQSAVTSVDYDLADVGGREYLLPVRSETEIHGSRMWARNKMEFREYRKFSADSTIEFGVGK